MQANPSNRWKNEVLELVEEHDFDYKESYDAGRGFRQEDHQCDFCGTHLRYTAIIYAEDDPSIEREVGLDCLEHAFGTKWSKIQDVERDIKDLKEEAKKERRREKFQEEYGNLMEWIRKYLDIKYNSFLESMLEILETGKEEFTRPMEDRIRDIIDETDFEELRREQREKEREKEIKGEKIERLLELIIEVDELETENGKVVNERKVRENNSAFDFTKSVYEFLQNRGFVSDKQMNVLNDIYSDYKDKQQVTV